MKQNVREIKEISSNLIPDGQECVANLDLIDMYTQFLANRNYFFMSKGIYP